MLYFLEDKVSIYINYLEFCTGDLSILPHLLICSIIYLYKYGPMGIYFILWLTIQYYLFILLAVGNSFSWLLWPFDVPQILWRRFFCGFCFVFWALPGLQVLWDTPGSFYIFSAPVLESATSVKSPGSFQRMVLEIKTWVLSVLVAMFLGPLMSQS